MNYSLIFYILGWVMNMEAVFMMLPCIVALCYGEKEGWAFLIVAVFSIAAGLLIIHRKPQKMNFYVKEGFVTVALSWIVLSLIGALPFVISGDIPNYIDALFETISGFTTTGASILSDIEALSKCSLFWRSFTNWIGGMGVLVFLLIIMPLTGGSTMTLVRAESPGPSAGKLVPKIRHTAGILYGIYIGLTMLLILFLLFGKKNIFEALTTAFSVAGTGGFAIKNSSFMEETRYVQWLVTIFMALFGINFSVYYLILMKKWKSAWKHEEVRCYIAVFLLAGIVIFLNILPMYSGVEEALRHAFFQVSSIMTTTGFSSADFDLWPQTSKIVLLFLMFIGGCAGSTSGGIKVDRFLILAKTFKKEVYTYLHPRSVKKIKTEGKVLEHDVIRSTNVYIVAFMIVFGLSLFIISMENYDFETNVTAVASLINNIGPGFSLAGPTQNFGFFSNLSKCVLMFDMLAGRLELFPLLILLCPAVWKRSKG